MQYREATASDVAAIAGPHADSWRRHYRGAYLDSYLDGDVLADRMTEWTARLSGPRAGRHTVVADLKRRGIGARLIAEAGRAVARSRPATGFYLWVLERNAAAQAFYAARGGRRVGRELSGPFPGGGLAFSLRYAWPDPFVLAGESRLPGLFPLWRTSSVIAAGRGTRRLPGPAGDRDRRVR